MCTVDVRFVQLSLVQGPLFLARFLLRTQFRLTVGKGPAFWQNSLFARLSYWLSDPFRKSNVYCTHFIALPEQIGHSCGPFFRSLWRLFSFVRVLLHPCLHQDACFYSPPSSPRRTRPRRWVCATSPRPRRLFGGQLGFYFSVQIPRLCEILQPHRISRYVQIIEIYFGDTLLKPMPLLRPLSLEFTRSPISDIFEISAKVSSCLNVIHLFGNSAAISNICPRQLSRYRSMCDIAQS